MSGRKVCPATATKKGRKLCDVLSVNAGYEQQPYDDSFILKITGPTSTLHQRVNTSKFYVTLSRRNQQPVSRYALQLGPVTLTLIGRLERLSSRAFEGGSDTIDTMVAIPAFRSTTGATSYQMHAQDSVNYGEGPANIIFADGTMPNEMKERVKSSILDWFMESNMTYTEQEGTNDVVIHAHVYPEIQHLARGM